MLVQAEGPIQDLRSLDEEEINSQQQAKKEGDTLKTQSDTETLAGSSKAGGTGGDNQRRRGSGDISQLQTVESDPPASFCLHLHV